MDLLEVIQTRMSTRAFKPTPIPREKIEKILQAAGKSPSYSNTRPWEVAVVTGKKRDELSKILYDLAKAETPNNPDMPEVTSWPDYLKKRSEEHYGNRAKVIGIDREDNNEGSDFDMA